MEVIGDVIDVMISLRDRLNGLKFDITNDKMMSSVRTFVPQLDTILEKLADTYVEVSGEME